MEGSAPKEQKIIQFPDQDTRDLHAGVSQDLNRAGHSASVRSINPHDQFQLEEIAGKFGDMARVVGGTIEENLGGANIQTHTGITEGRKGISIAGIRNTLKERLLKKAA